MINLSEVGAAVSGVSAAGVTATFGVYLPDIHAASGYEVWVRIIHTADRFNPTIGPFDHQLAQVAGSPYILWAASVTVPSGPGHQGQSGTYLYRYQLRLRLARALDLLGQYDDLTTLSLDLGFSSHSHFSAAFRQAYGRTPAAFQRSVHLR